MISAGTVTASRSRPKTPAPGDPGPTALTDEAITMPSTAPRSRIAADTAEMLPMLMPTSQTGTLVRAKFLVHAERLVGGRIEQNGHNASGDELAPCARQKIAHVLDRSVTDADGPGTAGEKQGRSLRL